MSSPTPGSDPDYPQGGAPQGQPGWNAPQGPAQGYGRPAPSYQNAPAGYGAAPGGQRPGLVTAAGIIGIVWGALGALFGLLVTFGAFALGAALAGLVFLLATAVSVALLWAGIQALQGQSPRLLLLISYVSIGLSVLSLIVSLVTTGGNAFSGILGILVPGAIVFLLMQPQSKQFYASRGISY